MYRHELPETTRIQRFFGFFGLVKPQWIQAYALCPECEGPMNHDCCYCRSVACGQMSCKASGFVGIGDHLCPWHVSIEKRKCNTRML